MNNGYCFQNSTFHPLPSPLPPPIKGFIETSFLDWPGQICGTFFLPSCNLRCPYCHNHDLVLMPDSLKTLDINTLLKRLSHLEPWIDGVCISGGEPTIHEGLPLLLKTFRSAGFKIKLDTNGTRPNFLRHLIDEQLVDFIAMDLKAPFDDELYTRCSGVTVSSALVAESTKLLATSGINCMFRCTASPALLTNDDIYHMAEQLRTLFETRGNGPSSAPSLILQNVNVTDPLNPSLCGTSPWPQDELATLQSEVNTILAYSGCRTPEESDT